MSVRTTSSSVSFARPFLIKGFDRPQAAGTYRVETDEEVIEGNERTVYKRVATLIYLPTDSGVLVRTVDPRELEAAAARDASFPADSD